jgi:bifunctional oligoribonuclease and PAP phosphatase NrnA
MIDGLDHAAEVLSGAKSVVLTCHQGPDGDSMGSMSALACLLRERGRRVTLLNPDPAPRFLRWLPHAETLARELGPEPNDLTVVVDCGDPKLLGKDFPPPERTGPLLVLDHHATSKPYGEVYYCDPGAAAVGVLVARLADRLGWELSHEASLGIYVSLVSDTGSFRYSNTNAEAFHLAARLVADLGIDPWSVAQSLGEEVPLARYRILAAALGGIELELGGRIAVITVTEDMLHKAGARWEHTEGIVGYARALEGVEVGVMLTPAREGGTRVSMRSKGRVDASQVCQRFGGGGHRGAAGCTIDGAIPDARARLLDALATALPHAA